MPAAHDGFIIRSPTRTNHAVLYFVSCTGASWSKLTHLKCKWLYTIPEGTSDAHNRGEQPVSQLMRQGRPWSLEIPAGNRKQVQGHTARSSPCVGSMQSMRVRQSGAPAGRNANLCHI